MNYIIYADSRVHSSGDTKYNNFNLEIQMGVLQNQKNGR